MGYFTDRLKGKLTPEELTKIVDALGDDFDEDVVPRSRLNRVIKQRNDLRQEIANVSKSSTGTEDSEDDDDAAAGTAKGGKTGTSAGLLSQREVNRLLKEKEAAHEKALTDLKIQYAVMDKLRGAKALDPELIYNGGLLDKSKIAFDDKGALTGLDEQLTELTKNKAFLFDKGAGGSGSGERGTGRGQGGDGEDEKMKELDRQLNNIFGGFTIDVDTQK